MSSTTGADVKPTTPKPISGSDQFEADPPMGADRMLEFENIIRRELELIGEDPHREGLLKTPERVAKAMSWLTRGYAMDVADVVGDAVFEEETSSPLVFSRDLIFF